MLNVISHQGDEKQNHSKKPLRTSLLVQWLRITLTTQGTRVRSLIWEDATCRGATKSMRHNDGPTLQSLCSETREATAVRSSHPAKKSSPCPPQPEKTQHNQKKEATSQALKVTDVKKKKVLCRTWRNKSEPSCTTGGKAKRCSCSGRQTCASSTEETQSCL